MRLDEISRVCRKDDFASKYFLGCVERITQAKLIFPEIATLVLFVLFLVIKSLKVLK